MKTQSHPLSVLTFTSTFLAAAMILGGALPIDSSFAGPRPGRYKGKAVRTTSKGKPKSRALPGAASVTNTTDPGASFGNKVNGKAKKGPETVEFKLELGGDGNVTVRINGRTYVGTLNRSRTSSRPRSTSKYAAFRATGVGLGSSTSDSFSVARAVGKVGRYPAIIKASTSSAGRFITRVEVKTSPKSPFGRRYLLVFRS